MKKAAFKIQYKSNDITNSFSDRLISLQIVDNSGFEADTIAIELSDTDGALTLPSRGVELAVALGWDDDGGLEYTNKFTVDECEHNGPPDVLTIRGKSANFRDSLNIKREQSYDATTIGAIAQTIADRNKLKCSITPEITAKPIDHADQTQESDASFLTRLLIDYDAIASVKNGILIIFLSGAARTVTGTLLPKIIITRDLGDSHHFSIADREAYTGVKAYWLDYKTAKVTSSKKQGKNKDNSVLAGSEGNIKVLRHTYATKQNANRAAQNQWKKLQRGACQFSMKLAIGRPDLFPQSPVTVKGFKPEIDSSEWILKKVTHNLTAAGGYTTDIELEINLD